MRRVIGGVIPLCVVCSGAFAAKVTLLTDTDTSLERAKDIVVAECISIPAREEQEAREDNFQSIEVNILKVLKGSGKPGRFRIATIYPMKPHTTYMLYNLGGSALGTDFLALSELSVVPLPATFKVEELKDKELKEQVQYIFSRRLFEVERELAPLLKEKELLEKAVSDRRYEWYESDGPVKIGRIVEVSTQTDESQIIRLDLEGKKLMWSGGSPGKSGSFYFEKMGASWTPYWEFSPCDVSKIENLVDKPLKAKFYGMYTPGRGDTVLGSTGGLQAIDVSVGQVLLARTVDDPRRILVIRIEKQAQDQEQMSMRYAVILHH